EACSGFTHVTARRIAQPPKATFVTRLQPCQLPGRAARQLPDQSTTLWVDSSSTSDSRLRGALPQPDSKQCLGFNPQLLCCALGVTQQYFPRAVLLRWRAVTSGRGGGSPASSCTGRRLRFASGPQNAQSSALRA